MKRHPVGCLLALACVLVIVLLQSCSSSLVSIGNAGAGALGATTYPSEDEAILGAEAAYAGLEAELQTYLDTYESTHDYDEYHFDLDKIEHDPYVLISLLSALHEGEWTLSQVEGSLQMLFDRQYVQTVWNVITDVKNYIWRTDLSKTEIISDKQFIEYTKNGYATTFTITLFEPYKRWEFDMENSNIKGHWIGIFTQKGEKTEIDFTEDVTAKKVLMKPFVKAYLKKQQARYVKDLARKLKGNYE